MYCRIENILKSKFFHDTEIIAGLAGKSKQILGMEMLEDPDGYHYMRPGNLILASGHRWLKTAKEQEELILHLLERNVAGICLRIQAFNWELPVSIKEKADKLAIPIITFSEQYAYTEVLNYFFNHIYYPKQDEFISLEQVQANLFLKCQQMGVAGVGELLADLLMRPVVLLYEEKQYVYNAADKINAWQKSNHTQVKSVNFEQTIFQTHSYQQYLDEQGKEVRFLACEFAEKAYGKAVLFIWETETLFGKQDIQIILLGLQACQWELNLQKKMRQEALFLQETFIENLLAYKGATLKELQNKAEAWQWQLPEKASVLLLDLAIDDEAFFQVKKNIKNCLWSSNKLENSVIARYHNRIIVLLPQEKNLRLVEYLYTELQKMFMLKANFRMAVGNREDYKNYKRSYDQAEQTLLVSSAMVSNIKPIFYQQLSLFRLFNKSTSAEMKDEAESFYQEYIKIIHEFDQEHTSCLVDTLRVFNKKYFNYKETAKVLFVHPNTIRYRIKQVEELLEINLSNEDERLDLLIGLKLYDVFLK